MNKALVLVFLLSVGYTYNFQPKTVPQVTEGFKKNDINQDGLLSPRQLKAYFDQEYMKTFQGIDIDHRFIDASFEYIKSQDTDKNGHTVEQLIKGVIPDKTQKPGKKQPNHYPEQEL